MGSSAVIVDVSTSWMRELSSSKAWPWSKHHVQLNQSPKILLDFKEELVKLVTRGTATALPVRAAAAAAAATAVAVPEAETLEQCNR